MVGAGPSGLILALQLARAGIRCTLLDAGHAVDERPRAAHYMPCAILEMRRAGVLDDVRAQGIIPGNICWRKLDHSIVAEMKDSSQINNPDALTVLPLGDLGKLLVKHAGNYANLEINWDHTVDQLEQDTQGVTVRGKRSDGTAFEYTGDYCCGTDGGNSMIRKLLFGNRFDGKTWDTQIIATNASVWQLHLMIVTDFQQVYYPMETMGLGETNFIMVWWQFLLAIPVLTLTSILSITSWAQRSHEMVYGVSHMVNPPICPSKKFSNANHGNMRQCCQANRNRATIAWQTSIPTEFTKDVRRGFGSAVYA